MSRRGWIIAVAIVAVLALGGPLLAMFTDTAKPEQKNPPIDLASTAVTRFLDSYVDANGQAQTKGSGISSARAQSLALLVAAAGGDNQRFAAILAWTNANVATSDRPADVTLNVAWALAAASQRMSIPEYLGQANALAPDVVSEANGAGLNNALFFRGLDQLNASLSKLALSSIQLNQREAIQNQMGSPTLKSLPVDPATKTYSGDALNQPLNLATSCDAGDQAAAAFAWTKLRDSRTTRVASALGSNGKVVDKTKSVRAAVASAAAAQAAAQQQQSYSLLDDADSIQSHAPSFEGAAYDALGRVLLTTPWLGHC